MTISQIARIAYEANRTYSITLGEENPAWPDLSDPERELWRSAVWIHTEHPGADPAWLQDQWLRLEAEYGWSYGPKLDNAARRHPHHVPWDHLAPEHRVKILIVRDVIAAVVAATAPPSSNGARVSKTLEGMTDARS